MPTESAGAHDRSPAPTVRKMEAKSEAHDLSKTPTDRMMEAESASANDQQARLSESPAQVPSHPSNINSDRSNQLHQSSPIHDHRTRQPMNTLDRNPHTTATISKSAAAGAPTNAQNPTLKTTSAGAENHPRTPELVTQRHDHTATKPVHKENASPHRADTSATNTTTRPYNEAANLPQQPASSGPLDQHSSQTVNSQHRQPHPGSTDTDVTLEEQTAKLSLDDLVHWLGLEYYYPHAISLRDVTKIKEEQQCITYKQLPWDLLMGIVMMD